MPCRTHYDSLVHEVSTRSSQLITVFRRLRPEEGLLAIAFVASAVLTIYANVDLYQQQINSRRIQGGLLRLALVVGLAAILPWLERTLRRRQGSRRWLATAEFVRTFLPFVMCIAVYTNLHDTVRYVNTHDIHPYLSAVEEWIFGGQPVLWAEAYITPARTEFFNAFYANFYLVAPSVVLILWFSGRSNEARTALLGIIVCFYTGYVLYVLLPAAPPRLYYGSLGLFKVTLTRRAHHELPGVFDRDDAEPRGPRGVPQPSFGRQLPQPVLRVEVLPLVLPDPARVRDRAARVHGLPAPPLGGRSPGRHVPRALDRVACAQVRAVVEGERERPGNGVAGSAVTLIASQPAPTSTWQIVRLRLVYGYWIR